VNHHSLMSTSSSTDKAHPTSVIAKPLPPLPPLIEPTTLLPATLEPGQEASKPLLEAQPAKEVVVVDLSQETMVKLAEEVEVFETTTLPPPPKKLKAQELPVFPPLSSYPPYPFPRAKMVGPAQIVYHDQAYNAIQFPADFDDEFADTLAAICKVTVNTHRHLYATGIHSMATMVKFFATHEEASKFINGVTKKEGKEMNLPLYHNPNFCNQEVTLCFPLVQQIWSKALRLYGVSHAYCGIPYNLAALDEATILPFGLFVTTVNSGKTTKDMPETSIPSYPPLAMLLTTTRCGVIKWWTSCPTIAPVTELFGLRG
jgi:hypothetical protein